MSNSPLRPLKFIPRWVSALAGAIGGLAVGLSLVVKDDRSTTFALVWVTLTAAGGAALLFVLATAARRR